MTKESTYQEKFALLKAWMPAIADVIKRDLKSAPLAKKYLPSKPAAKLTADELAEGYARAIAEDENGEGIGEWVAQRWLLKKTDLYEYFGQELTKINPEFDQIEEIDAAKGKEIIEGAVKNFGALDTYLFAVINAVVFSDSQFKDLAKEAEESHKNKESARLIEAEEKAAAKTTAGYEQQIARLTDKYEKKIQGLERKYLNDTESLKKQLALLQKRLSAHSCAGV